MNLLNLFFQRVKSFYQIGEYIPIPMMPYLSLKRIVIVVVIMGRTTTIIIIIIIIIIVRNEEKFRIYIN